MKSTFNDYSGFGEGRRLLEEGTGDGAVQSRALPIVPERPDGAVFRRQLPAASGCNLTSWNLNNGATPVCSGGTWAGVSCSPSVSGDGITYNYLVGLSVSGQGLISMPSPACCPAVPSGQRDRAMHEHECAFGFVCWDRLLTRALACTSPMRRSSHPATPPLARRCPES
jgi:hypothetical protein